jgi:hypothetical protein
MQGKVLLVRVLLADPTALTESGLSQNLEPLDHWQEAG